MDNVEFSDSLTRMSLNGGRKLVQLQRTYPETKGNMQTPHSPGPGMEPTVQNTMGEHRLSHLTSSLPCQQNGIDVAVGQL